VPAAFGIPCNTALGFMRDDHSVTAAASAYLLRRSATTRGN